MASNPNLTEQIDKLENKIKLSNLLTGKKFADLELTVGNLDQKLKEISTDFPKLKERAEEIDDLLNIINLGLVEFKNNLDELKSRFVDIQKVPVEINKRMTNYENKLNCLDENVKKLSETLTTLSTIKEDVNETIRKTILPDLETLKSSNVSNKLEMEHMKRDLDTFSSTVKSFERTIELTNVDALLKRFESLDNKINDIQSQLENFKNTLHGLMIFRQKMDDLNLIDAVNELKSSLRSKDVTISENQAKIEDLEARLDRISNVINRTLAEARTDQTAVKEVYTKVKEMYDKISREVSELKNIEGKLKLSEADTPDDPPDPASDPPDDPPADPQLPTDISETLSKMNERIITLEKHHNELVDILQKEIKDIKNDLLKPAGTEDLRKKLDELERAFISREKGLVEYKKQVENRLKTLESKKIEGSLPKDLMKELSSLREITSQLVTENNEFRRLARDLRVAQLAAVKPEVFAAIADRVLALEKKISEIEVKGKESVPQSQLEITPIFDKMSNLEKRLSEIEEKISKEHVLQVRPENLENVKKEIESLKSIIQEKESTLEEKISKIEKKMSEESVFHPLVLE